MNSFVRASLFFALFVTLGLTFGFLTFKILSFSRTVEVPSVTNMTLIEADKYWAMPVFPSRLRRRL